MRAVFLTVHRVLSLTLGFVIAFLGLSGSLLIFGPELDARFNPKLLLVEPQNSPYLFQNGLEAVHTKFPDETISFYFAPKAAGQSGQWWLDGGQKRVYTNPYSGQILGWRGETEGFFPWLYVAHTHLFTGDFGEKLAGWSGLFLISIALSGLVLWFPRSRFTFRHAAVPNLKGNWKGRNYELHRVGGFWLSSLFLLAGTTGSALVFHDQADFLMKPFGLSKKAKVSAPKVALGNWENLDELAGKANAAMPEGVITRITFPSRKNPAIIFRKKTEAEIHPNGLNNITLRADNGEVLAISKDADAPAGQKVINARYPIHLGLWAGNFSRVLQMIAGMSLPLFYFSGLYLWWHKRSKQKSSAKSH